MDVVLYEKLLKIAGSRKIDFRATLDEGYYFVYFKNHKSAPIVADFDRKTLKTGINDAIEAAIQYFTTIDNNQKMMKEWSRENNNKQSYNDRDRKHFHNAGKAGRNRFPYS